MLVYLDVAIGFATLMLGLSLVLTVVAQAVSGLAGWRGTSLRWGLETLFARLGPLLAPRNRRLADEVLTHCVLSDSALSGIGGPVRWRLATAVRLTELRVVLNDLRRRYAADDKPVIHPPEINRIVADPNLDIWFGAMMDRVAQQFAMKIRVCTVLASAVLVLLLNVDAIRIVNQLLSDAQLRSQLGNNSSKALTSGTAADALGGVAFQLFPTGGEQTGNLFGYLVSVGLLSLGAPFWFNALKALSSLRPLLASRVKEAPEGGESASAASAVLVGARLQGMAGQDVTLSDARRRHQLD